LIARIGLPPGSEVDRGTLAPAIADPKTGVDSSEVEPDSVTVYIWPCAADNAFSFVFRPRFPLTAKSSGSLVYDYYNPNDRAALAPQLFRVR
jgi:A-macroglobulin receptor